MVCPSACCSHSSLLIPAGRLTKRLHEERTNGNILGTLLWKPIGRTLKTCELELDSSWKSTRQSSSPQA
jgi:hypothetical protein